MAKKDVADSQKKDPMTCTELAQLLEESPRIDDVPAPDAVLAAVPDTPDAGGPCEYTTRLLLNSARHAWNNYCQHINTLTTYLKDADKHDERTAARREAEQKRHADAMNRL